MIVHDFRVRIWPAEDVAGQWLSECEGGPLQESVMTQGNSPWHAFEMVAEAVRLVIEDSER